MEKKRVRRSSLASLAAELGVSRTTVSNAYNRPEELSPQLRRKILATAAKRGYPGPDPMARGLRTKEVGSVGVLLTEHMTYAFEDMASVDFLAGMATASTGSQTSLTLIPVGPHAENDSVDLLNQAVVDGFVIYSVAADEPFLRAVERRGLPGVICDQPKGDLRFPFVGIDDKKAIAPAAQALIHAGHRSIGILCIRLSPQPNNGPVLPDRLRQAKHHVQRDRVLGALEVFAAAGIDPQHVPIIERHLNDMENNYQAAAELLGSHPHLTAILCTTDTMALGVMAYARDHGMSIPAQLSLTGFDGTSTALIKDLSTVIQPNKLKGEWAGRILFQQLQGKEISQRTLLEVGYNPGQTVASPDEDKNS
ncbi:substrate-binding domain-containing protein [Corynebacterium sp. ES2794-CONJ1]|uniref:LacI family DNA-binding transcriptional regulator n=1 Tax=unclassified Corynebacterium TaxID=2624378 RepID=UPI0021693EFA|nr:MULTISPECIES: substrate-binding domain-containing protein [unclassified Corynebacterium]MCS4490277.1 substrate-binding domain-containing protein [Corynebacterium sp. ES2775-CONJ]MCS4491912.1 substrate-binding domain-containing protein [Corynebacterium sp. ES2715-CONJ3]MCS4532017.1 substrate-binding domain-containing protein [Corynebacterium sp. ES2730-CONJ]MCU9519418.1 substrate-binding domain-containing protein [Corynebacterium sp. ES2794-CONJ1]